EHAELRTVIAEADDVTKMQALGADAIAVEQRPVEAVLVLEPELTVGHDAEDGVPARDHEELISREADIGIRIASEGDLLLLEGPVLAITDHFDVEAHSFSSRDRI